jgi:hypothetical protein
MAVLMLSQGGTALAESGRDNYILHCMGCHLDDGRETPGIVPALIDAGRFLDVPGGREFLIRVPGVSSSTLDNTALAALMNWLLHEFSTSGLPADFEPYTADEIGRYRSTPLAEVDVLRDELLAALERKENR